MQKPTSKQKKSNIEGYNIEAILWHKLVVLGQKDK